MPFNTVSTSVWNEQFTYDFQCLPKLSSALASRYLEPQTPYYDLPSLSEVVWTLMMHSAFRRAYQLRPHTRSGLNILSASVRYRLVIHDAFQHRFNKHLERTVSSFSGIPRFASIIRIKNNLMSYTCQPIFKALDTLTQQYIRYVRS